jgi:hypothetical protein
MDRGQMGRKHALTESSCSEAAINFWYGKAGRLNSTMRRVLSPTVPVYVQSIINV